MTREEILHNLELIEDELPFDIKTLDKGKLVFVGVSGLIAEIKEILKQEPCEDAISREQAIELASGACHPANVAKELTKLPSVYPQEKTGHWIMHPKGIYAHLVCDKCLSNAPYDCRTNYCPNCGHRMVEPQESEG